MLYLVSIDSKKIPEVFLWTAPLSTTCLKARTWAVVGVVWGGGGGDGAGLQVGGWEAQTVASQKRVTIATFTLAETIYNINVGSWYHLGHMEDQRRRVDSEKERSRHSWGIWGEEIWRGEVFYQNLFGDHHIWYMYGWGWVGGKYGDMTISYMSKHLVYEEIWQKQPPDEFMIEPHL